MSIVLIGTLIEQNIGMVPKEIPSSNEVMDLWENIQRSLRDEPSDFDKFGWEAVSAEEAYVVSNVSGCSFLWGNISKHNQYYEAGKHLKDGSIIHYFLKAETL